MLRFLPIVLAGLGLLSACNQPVRTYPFTVNSGLDSTEYAGHVEGLSAVDLSKARYLAKFKVGDLGVNIDCSYPDALRKAKDVARGIGGNLIVVTTHKRHEYKSKCHKIIGNIYVVPSLEGVESQILWHAKRPLMPGDLRGKRPAGTPPGLPPLSTTLDCRITGDYFAEAVIRTRSAFWSDSTFMAADSAFALRRAQLHFDLTELHARKLKAALVQLGSNLPAITGQHQALLANEREQLRAQKAALDAELANGNRDAVLARWENSVRGELATLDAYWGDILVNLRKKKRQ